MAPFTGADADVEENPDAEEEPATRLCGYSVDFLQKMSSFAFLDSGTGLHAILDSSTRGQKIHLLV